MSARTIHMSLSVRGALQWSRPLQRRMANSMTHDDGRRFTEADLREWLMDALAQGFEVLPLGKPCEGFDPKNGCPGHPAEVSP